MATLEAELISQTAIQHPGTVLDDDDDITGDFDFISYYAFSKSVTKISDTESNSDIAFTGAPLKEFLIESRSEITKQLIIAKGFLVEFNCNCKVWCKFCKSIIGIGNWVIDFNIKVCSLFPQ